MGSYKKKIITFLLISLLFKPLWLFNNQNLGQPADDMYHWLHSATLAFDFGLFFQSINSIFIEPMISSKR